MAAGERKAIVKEAVQAVREEISEARYTPPVQRVSDSTERMFEVAETVIARREPVHMRHCENAPDGPACKLATRLDDIDKEIAQMKLDKAEERGEAREMAREAGKSGALRMAIISAGLAMLVGLGNFLLNRANASPTHDIAQRLQQIELRLDARKAGIP